MTLLCVPLPFLLCILSLMTTSLELKLVDSGSLMLIFLWISVKDKTHHRYLSNTTGWKSVFSVLPSAMRPTDKPWHSVPSEWPLFITSLVLQRGCPWQHQCNFHKRILAECFSSTVTRFCLGLTLCLVMWDLTKKEFQDCRLSCVFTVPQDQDNQAILTLQTGATFQNSFYSGNHFQPACCHFPVRRQRWFWQAPHKSWPLHQQLDWTSMQWVCLLWKEGNGYRQPTNTT